MHNKIDARYESVLLTQVVSQDALEEMIGIIRNGIAVAWQHVNLLGEYDFNTLLINGELRFNLQKILECEYKRVDATI